MSRPIVSNEIMVPIDTDADVVAARQKARELSIALGFSVTDSTLIATAVSELARNIVSYAKRGQILIRPVHLGEKVGIAVVARDEGPGIANVALAMQDGFSTSGSLGLGLPGVKRLMDEFDIHSQVSNGTVVTVRKWKR